VGADQGVQLLAHLVGAAEIALGVLLDQPFEQADGEGDPRPLYGLQAAGGRRAGIPSSREPMRSPLLRAIATGSAALQRSATVGAAAVMSNTPSARTATTLGPSRPWALPIRVPAVPSSGRISATGRLRRFVAEKVRHSGRNQIMAAARIKGVLSPVVTPFKRDLSPDGGRFIAHCKWLLSQDCGLAVFGTNSEANSMSARERMALLDKVVGAGVPTDRM